MEERGHFKDGIIPFIVGNKRIFRCPLTLIEKMTWEYIKAYGLYEDGFLPHGKGWLDESYKFNQAIAILKNEFQRRKNLAEKKLKKHS